MYSSGNTFTFIYVLLHKIENQEKYNCLCNSCISLKKNKKINKKNDKLEIPSMIEIIIDKMEQETKETPTHSEKKDVKTNKQNQYIRTKKSSTLEEKMYRGIPI